MVQAINVITLITALSAFVDIGAEGDLRIDLSYPEVKLCNHWRHFYVSVSLQTLSYDKDRECYRALRKLHAIQVLRRRSDAAVSKTAKKGLVND